MKGKILLLFKWSLFILLIMVAYLPSNATIGDNKIVPKIIDPVDLCPGRIAGTEPCILYSISIMYEHSNVMIFSILDSDCDGWSDDDEKLAGTDPNCCNDSPDIGFRTFGNGRYGCGKNKQEMISNSNNYDHFIRKAAKDYNISPCLLKALLAHESYLIPYIRGSDKGGDPDDEGIAQLNNNWIPRWCGLKSFSRPDTCGECGNRCPKDWPEDNTTWNPEDAINCAAKYLKSEYDNYTWITGIERWKFAVATYNAGWPRMQTCINAAKEWYKDDYEKTHGVEPTEAQQIAWVNVWDNIAFYIPGHCGDDESFPCKCNAKKEVDGVMPLYNQCIQKEEKK